AVDATGATDRQAVHQRTANGDRIGAKRQCFHDIGAATNAAIHDDGYIALQGLGNFRQYGNGGRRAIKRAPTMVGYLYCCSARFDGSHSIFGPRNAFDYHRQSRDLPYELDVVPRQVRLEGISATRREIAIGQPWPWIAQAHVLVG